jgi:hypothetical protein
MPDDAPVTTAARSSPGAGMATRLPYRAAKARE